MAGTKLGGARAAATNKEIYGDDFYSRIGRLGGQKGNTGGFASTAVGADGLTGRERARIAGASGGRKSRRSKKKAFTLPVKQQLQEDAAVSRQRIATKSAGYRYENAAA